MLSLSTPIKRSKSLFRSSLVLVLSFYFYAGCAHAANKNVNIKIVGNRIVWTDAINSDSLYTPGGWSSTVGLKLLPVKSWSPAFAKSGDKNLEFVNPITSETVNTTFDHAKISFKYDAGDATSETSSSSGRLCETTDDSGGSITLTDTQSSDCVANKELRYNTGSKEPFEFYNSSFQLEELVDDFRDAGVSEGNYVAIYNYTLRYTSTLENGVYTYNYYPADTVTFTVDYTPAFIDSVIVEGDGEFELEYNTDLHTVRGETDFSITVNGYIDPGLLISLSSSGSSSDVFELENETGEYKIQYSVTCSLCTEPEIVSDGSLVSVKKAELPFSGTKAVFDLNFNFDDQTVFEPSISETGTVIEGVYSDTVTLLLELDI